MIRFACPNPRCRLAQAAHDSTAGQTVRCENPSCGWQIEVPTPPPQSTSGKGVLLEEDGPVERDWRYEPPPAYSRRPYSEPDYDDYDRYDYPRGDSQRIPAGVLAIVLGPLGVHKFMLGYPAAGGVMLAVSIVGFICYGIGPLVMAGIGIAEGIIYLTKTDREFYNTYVRRRREWF